MKNTKICYKKLIFIPYNNIIRILIVFIILAPQTSAYMKEKREREITEIRIFFSLTNW